MADTIIGTFEPEQQGGGFLRLAQRNYDVHQDDVFVSPNLQRSLGLQGGEHVEGPIGKEQGKPAKSRQGKHGKGKPPKSRPPRRVLKQAERINEQDVEEFQTRKSFNELTAVDPSRQLKFSTPGGPISMRVVDLMAPIGFGQRGLIVAPPRTGKTVLLQQMAHGVATNHPDVYMMVLLIDERPEEVTDMRRNVNGEVIASSNDQNVASHVRIARLMIQKARRKVECGEHVVILLDSLTRLGRAFNAATRGGGRIMSGGLDARALEEPKAIFGAARNTEEAGSLTIIATALIDTGSRMDEVIFNEFKGTGNMEIMLCRDLANMRIWPAIDLQQSGTRKEELLLAPDELEASHQIRRRHIDKDPRRSMENLLEQMNKSSDNAEFAKQFSDRSVGATSFSARRRRL